MFHFFRYYYKRQEEQEEESDESGKSYPYLIDANFHAKTSDFQVFSLSILSDK